MPHFPPWYLGNKCSWGWAFSHMGIAKGVSGNTRLWQWVEQLVSTEGAWCSCCSEREDCFPLIHDTVWIKVPLIAVPVIVCWIRQGECRGCMTAPGLGCLKPSHYHSSNEQSWHQRGRRDALLKMVALKRQRAACLPFKWISCPQFYRLEGQACKKIRLNVSIAVSLPWSYVSFWSRQISLGDSMS